MTLPSAKPLGRVLRKMDSGTRISAGKKVVSLGKSCATGGTNDTSQIDDAADHLVSSLSASAMTGRLAGSCSQHDGRDQ
eukprot:6644495-Prymnesium_polylepis.1